MNRDKIIDRRTDMSAYLIHWTTKDDFDCIIRSGFLMPSRAPRWYWTDLHRGEGEIGYTIYGTRKAVCFTEMPIGNWIQSIIAHRSYADLRWGMAIPKRIFYAYGARPVLYVRKPEAGPKCPEEELWRQCPAREKFRLSNFGHTTMPDWTHEREWRVCADAEINERIGLKSDLFLHRCRKEGQTAENHVQGNSVIPIHLPGLTGERFQDALTDKPQFVIIVESECDKALVKKTPPKPLAEAIAQDYSPIAEYRKKYLAAFQEAQVVSLEYARDARDRLGLCSLEELLNHRRLQHIAILWDKARTETRRQVLGLIGEEADRGYEYYPGRDLWEIPPQGIIWPTPSVGKRIEECEQAVGALEHDVRAWLQECFDVSGA